MGKFFDDRPVVASFFAMKSPWRVSLLFFAGMLALCAAEPAKADAYENLGFDLLASFNYVPPETETAGPTQQIPESIKALDQRKVAVTGFMLPTKMDKGLVKEFLLVKDAMMCCYGAMPRVNEWIVVKMNGAGVKPLMDLPITFEGKLRVGEMFENGYLTGVYLLEGDRMASPKG
jgi:hypothetical protein